MDVSIVQKTIWISGIVLIVLIACFCVCCVVARRSSSRPHLESFEEAGSTEYTNDGSVWINTPECKHANTGYIFRSELLLNNQNDGKNNSCRVNGSMLGLLKDSSKCTVADDIPDAKWTNPLLNCGGNQVCKDALDLTNGVLTSGKTSWNATSCVVSFRSNATSAQLRAFEDSLLSGVTGFLSANVVQTMEGRISELNKKFDSQSNVYYTSMSTLETDNSNLSVEKQRFYNSNVTLSATSKSCFGELGTAKGGVKTCVTDLQSAKDNYGKCDSDLQSEKDKYKKCVDELDELKSQNVRKDGEVYASSLWPGLRFWAQYGGESESVKNLNRVTAVGFSTNMSDLGPATYGADPVPENRADFVAVENHTDWNYQPFHIRWSGYIYTPVLNGKVSMKVNDGMGEGGIALSNSGNFVKEIALEIDTKDETYPYYPVSIGYLKNHHGGILFTMTNKIPKNCMFLGNPEAKLGPFDEIKNVAQ